MKVRHVDDIRIRLDLRRWRITDSAMYFFRDESGRSVEMIPHSVDAVFKERTLIEGRVYGVTPDRKPHTYHFRSVSTLPQWMQDFCKPKGGR